MRQIPPRLCYIFLGYHTMCRYKGGLISESFSLCLKYSKKMPNHSPEHLFFKWEVLRRVIWYLFLEIWAEVKKILRLSHLYIFLGYHTMCRFELVHPAALKFSACGILSSSRYQKLAKHLVCLSVTDKFFFVKFRSVRINFLCFCVSQKAQKQTNKNNIKNIKQSLQQLRIILIY